MSPRRVPQNSSRPHPLPSSCPHCERIRPSSQGYQVHGIVADVSQSDGRKTLVDAVRGLAEPKGLGVLVNNVGTNVRKATVDYTEEEYRHIFATNLDSAYFLTRDLHPLLKVTSCNRHLLIRSNSLAAPAPQGAWLPTIRLFLPASGQLVGSAPSCLGETGDARLWSLSVPYASAGWERLRSVQQLGCGRPSGHGERHNLRDDEGGDEPADEEPGSGVGQRWNPRQHRGPLVSLPIPFLLLATVSGLQQERHSLRGGGESRQMMKGMKDLRQWRCSQVH